jgi:hypothetical protein
MSSGRPCLSAVLAAAIIEVKWLGYSVRIDASHISTSWTTDKRAQEGAKQLADYLEDNLERARLCMSQEAT